MSNYLEGMNMNDEERMNLEAELRELETKLLTGAEYGDWKIIKTYEYRLMGKDDPYNTAELDRKREQARQRIDEIRGLLGL
jgi:hypothetical protein